MHWKWSSSKGEACSEMSMTLKSSTFCKSLIVGLTLLRSVLFLDDFRVRIVDYSLAYIEDAYKMLKTSISEEVSPYSRYLFSFRFRLNLFCTSVGAEAVVSRFGPDVSLMSG